MADNEDREATITRVNEWEVVSLTASTYAAAPGPAEVESKDDDNGNVNEEDEAETSRALFMTNHFVFPPNKHDNLPLESNYSNICDELGGEDVVSDVATDEGVQPSGKKEENWPIAGLNVPEDFSDLQYLDEKTDKLSVHGKNFDEGSALLGFGSVDKEESIYDTTKYSSLHGEMAVGGANQYGENVVVSEITELAEEDSSASPELSQSRNFIEENKDVPLDLPCGAWWKQRVASLYAHVKETSTFWSIFIAAAVMGLVMLGQRWQQERALQLEWQIGMNDEGRSRGLIPIFRLKDVIVGGQRRGSLITASSPGER